MAQVVMESLMGKLRSMIKKNLGSGFGVFFDVEDLDRILSTFQREFGSVSDMETLLKMLSAIHDVLEDAERKQFTNMAIANWLNMFKTLAYDASDAIDKWSIRAQQTEDDGMTQELDAFSRFPLLYDEQGTKTLDKRRVVDSFINKFVEMRSKIFEFNLSSIEFQLHQNIESSFISSEPQHVRYIGLPPHLRRCITYCSIFPKGYEMKKDELIGLWIANGFIPSTSNGDKELEDVADAIFTDLSNQSFFGDPKQDIYGNLVACTGMPDHVHVLASFLTEGECSTIEVDKEVDLVHGIRHLSFISDSPPLSTSLYYIFKLLPSLRTLLFFNNLDLEKHCMFDVSTLTCLRALNLRGMSIENLPSSVCHLEYLRYLDISKNRMISLPESICQLTTLQFLNLSENKGITRLPLSIGDLKCLRSLNLSQCSVSSLPISVVGLTNLQRLDCSRNYSVTTLPFSTGNLQSLKYFNLSDCNRIRLLPDSICHQTNLQQLILRGCSSLVQLPESIRDMRSLRHLDIQGCSQLTKMPIGIGELKHLQTLNIFPVGKPDEDSGCGGMEELRGLDELRGEIEIQGLENVNANDAKEANLSSKSYLKKLKLSWGNVSSSHESNAKDILEGLQLPPNIQNLVINEYPWETFFPQEFLENLNSLQSLLISNCRELVSLPERLQTLNSLLSLSIESCDRLTSVSEGLLYLTSLESLSFQHCPQLELKSEDFNHLVSLLYLRIEWLPKLGALPEGIHHLTKLCHLEIGYCWSLKKLSEGMRCFTSLETLKIHYCPELEVENGGFQHVVSLQTLKLGFLPKLRDLSGMLQHLSMLQNLQVLRCENLGMLPKDLKYLTVLQSVEIRNCHPELHRRCDREKGEDWYLISHISHLDIDKPPQDFSTSADQFFPELHRTCDEEKGEDWHLNSHISHLDIDKQPKDSSTSTDKFFPGLRRKAENIITKLSRH